MAKLLGFFIFIGAFIWTWILFNTQDAISISVHAGVQNQLVQLIENSIKKHRPQSSDFQLIHISTEKIDDQKIAAHFSFRYNEKLDDAELTQQTLSGEAILNRGLSENPDVQKWIVQSIKSNSSQIDFKEGLVITSDGKSTEPTTNSANPESDQKAEEKKTD